MSCEQIEKELALYAYGELAQDEEERVEHHLAACASCEAELQRVRSMSRILTATERVPSEGLLAQCRMDLARAVRNEPAKNRGSWLEKLRGFMGAGVGIRVPAGALALVAIGFMAGKVAPWNLPFLGTGTAGNSAGLQTEGFVNVRSVERGADGKVHVSFDNVNRRSITGSLDDVKIRELLIAAMRDDSNPGLRVETADVLKNSAEEQEIRSALRDAVLHDPNVGVRMTALEALKPYAGNEEVRKTLTEALLSDANPGVRVKAIDLLTSKHDDSLVGPLQNLMQKEENSYVRARVSNLLREMNASVGTY